MVEEDITEAWSLSDGDNIDLSLTEVKARTADPDVADNYATDSESESDDEEADSDADYIPSVSTSSGALAIKQLAGGRRTDSEVGKRVRKPNTRYDNASWTRFDASDDES